MTPLIVVRMASPPTADTFQLHTYAVLAEEARAASGDAKAVQKIANCEEALTKGRSMLNRTEGYATQRQQADKRAAVVKDAIRACLHDGANSLQAISSCLDLRDFTTARGGQWPLTAVMRVMQRLKLEMKNTSPQTV